MISDEYKDQEELSPEDIEQEESARESRREALFALANSLLKKRQAAIDGRIAAGIDRRWREDQEAFDGLDEATKSSMIDSATGVATRSRSETSRSRVVVNIIRSKAETSAGRFCEIAMPVDDKNWALKVTPVPELNEALKDTSPAMQLGQPVRDEEGKPATMGQVAADIIENAKKRMAAMEAEVSDQLTECQYNAECRKVVWDAARLGTGVLKGPTVVRDTSKRWKAVEGDGVTVQTLEVEERTTPASRRVDPWNVYLDPACGDDHRKASYIWEKDTILPRDVEDLIGLPGYEEDQLIAVLSEQAVRATPTMTGKQNNDAVDKALAGGSLYELWEYHGEVNVSDIEEFDCGCDAGEGKRVSACIVFINDRPVKIKLNVLDTGDLPYDFFQWTKVSDSPYGIGIPRMMIWHQRIMTAAWRATMDNAGDSAGAQRVISRDLEPADGRWEFTRNKTWINNGDGDARVAFAQFQLDSRQGDLQAIIEMAQRFADQETSIPTLFQGEAQKAPETLGATNIMVDSNNVALRLRVKTWDDQITVPHLTRYYHFNMMYSPKEEIKGDYQVDARGVRVLLEKDQQSQAVIQLWPLLADPEIASIVDKKKAARQLFGAHRLDILKSEEQQEQEKQAAEQQQAQPPPDPATNVAQIRSQAMIEVAKMRKESELQALQLKQQDAALNRQHERELKEMDHQIEMMRLSNEQKISLDSIKAMLAGTTMKLRTQKELAASSGKAPQVAPTDMEPVGQAPPGEAFQR